MNRIRPREADKGKAPLPDGCFGRSASPARSCRRGRDSSLDRIVYKLHTIHMGERNPSQIEFRLLTLVMSELTGREVAKRYEKDTGKTISYGTLYTTFRRLKESGWVSVRDAQDEDGRLRYFQITGAGRRVLEAAVHDYEAWALMGRAALGSS